MVYHLSEDEEPLQRFQCVLNSMEVSESIIRILVHIDCPRRTVSQRRHIFSFLNLTGEKSRG